MKIIICSSGHRPRMEAQKWVTGDVHWVFNDYETWKSIKDLIPKGHEVHLCECPFEGMDRVAWKREWAERNLTVENEWYVTVDDNVKYISALPMDWWTNKTLNFDDHHPYDFRKAFETPCEDPTYLFNLMRNECEIIGTVFGGMAIENNYYFRQRKYQYWGYVRTSAAVVKNVGLPFWYWPGNMLEDFTRSVDVVCRYGKVLINRFCKPIKEPFQEGGIGSFEKRRPALVAVNEELMRRYPGLLMRVKGHDYQLTFKLRSQKTIDEWRRYAGYLV